MTAQRRKPTLTRIPATEFIDGVRLGDAVSLTRFHDNIAYYMNRLLDGHGPIHLTRGGRRVIVMLTEDDYDWLTSDPIGDPA